jgi:hypothetical protein
MLTDILSTAERPRNLQPGRKKKFSKNQNIAHEKEIFQLIS